nr:DNA-directed DNA polymerase [Tanacetum cinerariifolium]
MVRALLLDKKNQSSAPAPSPTPALVKAVESNCVTCCGIHSYQNCLPTSGNAYQDNIQEYVSQAATANYNQGNTDFRPQMVANQIRPPGFPPVQNNQNNFNRGDNFNQGGNFNQSQLHRPQVNQPLAYQAPVYQAPIPQTQSVSQTDFERYGKANDAVLRNIQSQSQRPTIPTPSKVVKQGTELTKDQVQTPSSQSIAHVQPLVTQSETLVSKPVVAPVSASMPNLKPSIPYPSRRNNERRREQANEQIKKFYEIFKDMSFEISFTDALILMPKFAFMLKALIRNKEKLSEMDRTPMNEHFSMFFPLSKTTNIRNEITRFQQRFDESFSEAWDRFNDLLRACPHHGFFELHQLDTFYNGLNVNDQDSLNSAAGGNFLDKMPSDCLKIIESKSKVRQSRAKAVVAKVNSSSFTPAISSDVAELKDMVRALLLDKKSSPQLQLHLLLLLRLKQLSLIVLPAVVLTHTKIVPLPAETFVKTTSKRTLPGNTITNPKEDLKGITTRSGVAYQGPTISTPSKVVKQGTEVTKDQVQTPSSQSTAHVQPPVTQSETLVSEPVVAPVSAPMPNLKLSIPYPSRREALILMPKFASTLKALIGNNEKLSEMARTLMNEHCSAVILNKLPKKLGDPGKFLIPCEFPGIDECLALADLGASINLMPLFVWKELSLPELTPTCMTLELADRSVSKPIGIAKDVSVKVGMFHFPADFVVVDFKPGPRVPLIPGRCFLKTSRALIDVHKEYSQKVLGFSNVTASGGPTPSDDPIVSTTSPTLTPFGIVISYSLRKPTAFLGLEDDPDSPKFDPSYNDREGDILMFEAILNSDPAPSLPDHEQSVPSFKNELKACEAKMIKSSVVESPEVELKDLPPHLEYAFLEGDNKLPVIIAKDLGDEEKAAMIKDYKPAVQHQRRVNPKIHDVIKKDVEKLLDAGLIYPISDSPWVSPVHCVPKKGGFTVVKNEENELIPTRLVTGWRVCIDYRKLNEATRKDQFPFPFMDQMLERLAGNGYYCFLDGFSGYFQIPIDPRDQKKQRLPALMERSPTVACLSVCAMRRERFKEGIVLGHKILKNEIEVDKAKVDVITKLPHPTTVKGVRSFLGHAGFYQRFIKDFSKISRPMTHLLEKDTPFIFSEECIKAFQTLKQKLTEAPILIAPNWDLPFELMCDASDFAIGERKPRKGQNRIKTGQKREACRSR